MWLLFLNKERERERRKLYQFTSCSIACVEKSPLLTTTEKTFITSLKNQGFFKKYFFTIAAI